MHLWQKDVLILSQNYYWSQFGQQNMNGIITLSNPRKQKKNQRSNDSVRSFMKSSRILRNYFRFRERNSSKVFHIKSDSINEIKTEVVKNCLTKTVFVEGDLRKLTDMFRVHLHDMTDNYAKQSNGKQELKISFHGKIGQITDFFSGTLNLGHVFFSQTARKCPVLKLENNEEIVLPKKRKRNH